MNWSLICLMILEMKLEIKEPIFDPFFTTKEEGKKTEFGPSTVYAIVKQSEENIVY